MPNESGFYPRCCGQSVAAERCRGVSLPCFGMDITVRNNQPEPTPRPRGFSAPRPDKLPLSAAVWDIAQRYDKGGATVTEALFEGLKALETEVATLKRDAGERLDRLI